MVTPQRKRAAPQAPHAARWRNGPSQVHRLRASPPADAALPGAARKLYPMVLNPAEPGGRRYDPLGQAEAKISELEQLLQKERDATEEQRRYRNGPGTSCATNFRDK